MSRWNEFDGNISQHTVNKQKRLEVLTLKSEWKFCLIIMLLMWSIHNIFLSTILEFETLLKESESTFTPSNIILM